MKPSFHRLEAALRHREADRVPLVEAAMSYEIMSRFLGREVKSTDVKAQVEFWTEAGYDIIPLTAGMMEPGKVTIDSGISKAIRDNQKDDPAGETWNLEQRAAIGGEADFDAFPWNAAAGIDFSKFYEAKKYLPEGMKIVALSGKIFTLSWLLMGYENFCVNLLLNRDFVRKVVERVAGIQLKAVETAIALPEVAAVWAVDDLAFGTGTMIRPDDFRELIFPWYKKFADICHKKGKYLFFHSDGVLWDVLDDLIGIGVDALHPIDPTCMDIFEMRRRTKGKLCLFGNVPNSLLMEGTPEQVAQYTKKLIATLAPGGGYCVASGNSVPEWASIDNYRAMVGAVMEYGRYPIRPE